MLLSPGTELGTRDIRVKSESSVDSLPLREDHSSSWGSAPYLHTASSRYSRVAAETDAIVFGSVYQFCCCLRVSNQDLYPFQHLAPLHWKDLTCSHLPQVVACVWYDHIAVALTPCTQTSTLHSSHTQSDLISINLRNSKFFGTARRGRGCARISTAGWMHTQPADSGFADDKLPGYLFF